MSDTGFAIGFLLFWILGSAIALAMSWGQPWALVMVDTVMGWIYVAAKIAGGVS